MPHSTWGLRLRAAGTINDPHVTFVGAFGSLGSHHTRSSGGHHSLWRGRPQRLKSFRAPSRGRGHGPAGLGPRGVLRPAACALHTPDDTSLLSNSGPQC